MAGLNAKSAGVVPGGAQSPAQTQSAAAASFTSGQQTGTGTAQNVAHGLGVTPSQVLVSIESLPIIDPTQANTLISQGTHTSTNVVVTVISGAKFRVSAKP